MSKPLILVTGATCQPPQAQEEFVREQRESFTGKPESKEPAQV